MWFGGHPGTGVIIPLTGAHGEPTTGTITTDTIITGIIIIMLDTDTGTITEADTTILTIVHMFGYIVPRWL